MKHILIIEDDKMLRDYLVYLLERAGYQVTACIDGEQAQAILADNSTMQPPINLIVMELLLPVMTGQQLLSWLRDREQAQAMGVVVLTDLRDDDDIADTLDAGADDYVVKPFQPKELLARVRKILSRQQKGKV